MQLQGPAAPAIRPPKSIRSAPAHSVPGQLPAGSGEHRRKQYLMHAFAEPMPRCKFAREIVIPPARDHKFDFIARGPRPRGWPYQRYPASPESGHFTSTILMTSRGSSADKSLAAGFNHHGVTAGEQFFGERRSFRLKQRFAAGDFDQRDAAGAIRRQARPLARRLRQRFTSCRRETRTPYRTTCSADCSP